MLHMYPKIYIPYYIYIYVKLKNITIIFYIKKIYFSFEKVIKVCSINHLCIKRKE